MIQHLPAFGICGYSGSGKTTLILELIRRLTAGGLKVGIIKHDVHGLNVDHEGKDSDRFFKAGADVLMRGPNELFLRAHRRPACAGAPAGREDIGLDEALRLLCPYYDVLLLEGHKSTPLVDKVWLLKDEDEECPPEAVNIMRVLRRDEDRPGIVMDMLQTWLPAKWLSTPLYAGVLIGGEGHRMGRPKHLVTTSDGRTWVEVIVSVVEPLVRQVVLLGKGEIPRSLLRLPVLPDVEDTRGPLSGMRAAMRWAPLISWFFVPCDLPFLSGDAVRWLLDQRRPGTWAVLPRLPGSPRPEPLLAYYDFRAVTLLGMVHCPSDFAENEKAATPLVPAALADAWKNVNTPADLAAAAPIVNDGSFAGITTNRRTTQ